MFAGTYTMAVDDKGRIAIPARFRQQLADSGSQIYITLGPNPCLEIYSAPQFQRLADDIQGMEDREKAELLKQHFIGFAVESEIDKQGRVLLPPFLRKRTGLDGSALVMGQITRFDIWPEAEWTRRFGGDAEGRRMVEDAFRALKR